MPLLDTSYKSVIKLAFPIIIGSFIQSTILFIDSYFLSEYDRVAFTAVGNAGLLFITFYMIGIGLSDAGQVFISNKYGKDDIKQISNGFKTNIIHLFYLAVFLYFLVQALRIYLLPEIIRSGEILIEMDKFLSYRVIGYLFTFLTLGITSFYIAIGKSVILLYNTVILCVINVVFDYLLIFGNYGFPELGSEGAAIATIIAEAVALLFSFVYLFKDGHVKTFELFKDIKLNKVISKHILKLAYPLMIQGFVSVGAWTGYFLMIEQMGQHENEVSQIIHKLYFLALIPMFGFAASTRTYVSNLLSERKIKDIQSVIKKIMIANYGFILLFIHGNILYPEFWISIVYNPEILDPQILSDTKKILIVVSGSILVHAAAMVFQNVISGSGDTLSALKFELISITAYLTVVFLLIFKTNVGITTVWLSEYLYFTLFLVLTGRYYFKGKWKTNEI